MKKHTIIPILFIILTPIVFSGCKPKDPCKGVPPDYISHLTIGDSIRSKVPHTGYDTMLFVNQHGDTIFMKGVGISKYTTENISYEGVECGYKETYLCDHESVNYSKDTTLSTTNLYFPFSNIIISADSFDGGGGSYDTQGGYTIYFLNGSRETMYYQSLQDGAYKDVLTIGSEIIKCTQFRRIYYNHHYGILQCTYDSHTWTRILN